MYNLDDDPHPYHNDLVIYSENKYNIKRTLRTDNKRLSFWWLGYMEQSNRVNII